MPVFSEWKEKLTLYMWENKNKTSYAKAQAVEQRYIQDAYDDGDVQMGDEEAEREAAAAEEEEEEEEEYDSAQEDEEEEDSSDSEAFAADRRTNSLPSATRTTFRLSRVAT